MQKVNLDKAQTIKFHKSSLVTQIKLEPPLKALKNKKIFKKRRYKKSYIEYNII